MATTVLKSQSPKRTKIVATIGPASSSAEMISLLIDKGVNVFRLNFSHGSADGHRQQAAIIRKVLAEKKAFAAILGDLQGPKIRLGDIVGEPILVNDGDSIILTTTLDQPVTEGMIPVKYAPLPTSVSQGDILLIDDGLIRVQVESVVDKNVHCTVIQGGELKSRKGINRLGGGLAAEVITPKDFLDIELAAEIGVDYLAVSFPCCADDLLPVKEKLAQLNVNIAIIAKVERAEAVETDEVLKALIDASDGVMVARGDLGVEIGDAQLIGVQKKIISFARKANKLVITATQMMESMISSPVPTRAEVFDVANAVLDGTDAVMLSAETATGKHPAKVVAAMADACMGAERHPYARVSGHRMDKTFQRVDEAIAMSAIYAANHLDNINGIVCLTESGKTALMMSRLSSGLPIYAMSANASVCNRMALYRGVIPILVEHFNDLENAYNQVLNVLAQHNLIQKGQSVMVTCGDIKGASGLTNTLKIISY